MDNDLIQLKLQALALAIKAAEHGPSIMEVYYAWIMKELSKDS